MWDDPASAEPRAPMTDETLTHYDDMFRPGLNVAMSWDDWASLRVRLALSENSTISNMAVGPTWGRRRHDGSIPSASGGVCS